MINPIEPEKVLVSKGFCSPYEAVTIAEIWTERNVQGSEPPRTELHEMVGVAVKDSRGFVTYAQYSQLSPLAP